MRGFWLSGIALWLASCIVNARPESDPLPPDASSAGFDAEAASASSDTTTPAADAFLPPGPTPTDPRDRLNFFVSGHSLTDDPFAELIVGTARGLGLAAEYNQQIVIGSPIRVRTRGLSASGWSGYRTGKNRAGSEGLDVVAELHAPRTVSGPYHALILTERHDLPTVLVWEDTVRHVRHYHDRLAHGNPTGETYLYQAWLEIRNMDDPTGWIAYERAAEPIWQCVASRVQTSLEASGQRSSIHAIPAGSFLAELVERAVAGRVPSLAGSTPRATLRQLFTDDVHLTRTGTYFVALVTFGHVYRRSPVGAPAPSGVDATLARALQEIAWELTTRSLASARPELSRCRALMRDSFCETYGRYRGETGGISSCRDAFRDSNRTGPFYFDASSDASYWFAAP
jgi:hypothetical protein